MSDTNNPRVPPEAFRRAFAARPGDADAILSDASAHYRDAAATQRAAGAAERTATARQRIGEAKGREELDRAFAHAARALRR